MSYLRITIVLMYICIMNNILSIFRFLCNGVCVYIYIYIYIYWRLTNVAGRLPIA